MSATMYGEGDDQLIIATWHGGYSAYAGGGGARTYDSFQKRRKRLGELSKAGPYLHQGQNVLVQKSLGSFNWREATVTLREMQQLKARASTTQQQADFFVDSNRPILVMCLADTHIAAWSTDYDLFQRITDEILQVPDLHLVLLGDLAHMAIKLRSVEEVSDNLLPPDLQLRYLESWLEEMQQRILFCVWGNHEVEREEAQSGGSRFAELYKRTAVYFGGIGHADVTVGTQRYRIAASHKFLGRSVANPVYGPQQYLLREGLDRDIAVAGDSHVPGMLKFTHGKDTKLAINTGSIQLGSGYARRYFSLTTHPVYPMFALHPEKKLFTPYWSLEEYLYR